MNLLSKRSYATVLSFLLISVFLSAQETPRDWHLLDKEKDHVPGISLEQAYQLLKKNNRKSTTVIVAVLDSGLDINHEDIKPVLWKNAGELGANNSDDDHNGYIDDVNGWNFIGGPNGKSLEAETLEATRLYKKYKEQFAGKNKFSIQPNEQADYRFYLQLMKLYNDGKHDLEEAIKNNQEEYDFFQKLIPPLQQAVGKSTFSGDELRKTRINNKSVQNLRENFFRILERNKERNLTSEKLIEHYEGLSERMTEMKTRLQYNYNLNSDGRALIGDNYTDLNEKAYGNNDVTKRDDHGTHVSGIIGAARDNGIGMNGIADDVLIMPIRSVPMGDEADKDIANGIRYAVDNGARIINMSFGKDFSPDKPIVDAAVKYALEKGVLLVHGAGNDSKNTDYYYNFPSALLADGEIVDNWIEVGASTYHLDEELPASFSNYGKQSVDIFAPGYDIYSTLPESKYGTESGTSMASPVVAGVAALLLSYFPELTPQQIKELIMESGTPYSIAVRQPGNEEKVPFSSLSKSGKIINAYEAVKLALEKYGK